MSGFDITHGLWIQSHLWVQTKESGVVPFKFTDAQKVFYNAVRKQQKENKPVRIIAVKPRQIRFTTVTQAIFFEDLWRNPNKNALVVGNDDSVAQNILSMTKRFYDHLSEDMKASKPLAHKTKKEIVYAHPHNSRQLVITSKKGDTGAKSYTFQLVHLSEVADYYQTCDPQLLWGTITASVPMESPNTMIVLESTGSGQDPFFYPMAKKAYEGELPGWQLVFIPWFFEKEYSLEPDKDFRLTYEEQALAKEHNISLAHMAWRRKKIITDLSGQTRLFQRYYPSTFDEAFQSTSVGLFDQATCEGKKEECKKHLPVRKGTFHLSEQGQQSFEPDKQGKWSVWENVRRGYKYIIGADPSRYANNSDRAAAHVIRLDGLKVVASFHGHIENHIFAKQLYACGIYYNTAELVPENNMAVLAYELDTHLHYPNLYMYHTGEEMGGSRSRRASRPGVNMNGKSRTVGIERLLKVYNDMLVCHDPEFWEQLMHFKQTEYNTSHRNNTTNTTMKQQISSKFKAESTAFEDDSVMALVCALYAIQDNYIRKGREESARSQHEQTYEMIMDYRRERQRKYNRTDLLLKRKDKKKGANFGCGYTIR